MTTATKKCCGCKKRFPTDSMISSPIGFFHSSNCRKEYAFNHTKKVIEKAKAIKQTHDKKAHIKRKKELKPKSKWLGELQTLVNTYVRLRDDKSGCISCDKPFDWNGQWHASHYYSRGHSSSLRFNLWNIHKSCSICNNHLSGNIGEYTPRLINKIGKERFNYLLNNKAKVSDYDVRYIERAIKIARKAIKRIRKRSERET